MTEALIWFAVRKFVLFAVRGHFVCSVEMILFAVRIYFVCSVGLFCLPWGLFYLQCGNDFVCSANYADQSIPAVPILPPG